MRDRVLEILIKARDTTVTAFGRLRRNLRAVERAFLSVTRHVAAFTAALGATVLGLTKLAEHGDKVSAVGDAFTRIVGDQTAALRRLRQAAAGTISDFQLMSLANQAMTLGAARSVEQFAEMVRIARILGRAQGKDALFALESFTIGLARQSPKILDNIGLQVQLGDTTTFTARVMQQARQMADELADSMGEGTAAGARFSTMMVNIKDRLAVVAAESPLVTRFFDEMTSFVSDLIDILSGDAELLAEAFKSLGRIAANAFSAAFLEAVGGAGGAVRGLLRSLEERIGAAMGLSPAEIDARRRAADAAAAGMFPDQGRPSAQALGNIRAELDALRSIAAAARAQAAARGAGAPAGPSGFAPPPPELGDLPFLSPAAAMLGTEGSREAAARRQANLRRARMGPFTSVPFAPPVTALTTPFTGETDPGLQGSKKELEEAAEAMRGAQQVAAAAMFGTAQAVILGSDNIAQAVTSMITQILQAIPSVGGGLLGTVIGGVGGLIGAAFSRRRDPVPVRMADIDDRAAAKLRDASREPIHITSIIETGGHEIARIERELYDRAQRDETVRFFNGQPVIASRR